MRIAIRALEWPSRRARSPGLARHSDWSGFIPLAGYAGQTTSEGTLNSLGGGGTGQAKMGIARYQGAFQQFFLPTKVPAFGETKRLTAAGNDATDYGDSTVKDEGNITMQYAIQSALIPQYPCDQANMLSLTCWANNADELPDCKSLIVE